jgi:hypothetical protein
LKNGGYAEGTCFPRISCIKGLSVYAYIAGVRPDGAGEDLDECTFAGAILAQERMYFTAAAMKGTIREGGDAAIVFGNTRGVDYFYGSIVIHALS